MISECNLTYCPHHTQDEPTCGSTSDQCSVQIEYYRSWDPYGNLHETVQGERLRELRYNAMVADTVHKLWNSNKWKLIRGIPIGE